jgi:hypothetical protein
MGAMMDSFDSFTFEIVSISEAKEALEHVSIGGRSCPETPNNGEVLKQELMAQRQPNQLRATLNEAAYAWIMYIPETTRPLVLAQQYPRILNRIVDLWKRPLKCDDYLEELIIDKRGDRQGFPDEITDELTKLKVYFDANFTHVYLSQWGDRIGDDVSRFRK